MMRECAAPPFAMDVALQCDARWQPHDLLRLRRLPTADGEPAWVRDAFLRAPFVVVRRALAARGLVAAGVRGASRAQRYGTWVEAADVETVFTPQTLLATREPSAQRRLLPAFAALAALRRDAACLAQFVWGPTGSVGFELATQLPSVTASSDLDLLIRTPQKVHHAAAHELLDDLNRQAERVGIRVDAQLETPAGGIALAELAAGKPRVMVRAARGAAFVDDPWAVTLIDQA